MPFSNSFGTEDTILKILDEKEIVDKLDEYKYKFCVINGDIKFYAHARQIYGFGFFIGSKLHFFPDLSCMIQKYLFYIAKTKLRDYLIEPNHIKKLITLSNNIKWNIDLYIVTSKGFAGAISLAQTEYYPHNNSFTLPLKLDEQHIGKNITLNSIICHDINISPYTNTLQDLDFYPIIVSYTSSELNKLYLYSFNNTRLINAILYLEYH